MARACADVYKADIGIGVTGTMGNIDPANKETSVPGQVFYAVMIDRDMQSYYSELDPQPTRLAYKLEVAQKVYESIMARM